MLGSTALLVYLRLPSAVAAEKHYVFTLTEVGIIHTCIVQCTLYCNGIIAKYLLNAECPYILWLSAILKIPFSVIEKYKKMYINGKL